MTSPASIARPSSVSRFAHGSPPRPLQAPAGPSPVRHAVSPPPAAGPSASPSRANKPAPYGPLFVSRCEPPAAQRIALVPSNAPLGLDGPSAALSAPPRAAGPRETSRSVWGEVTLSRWSVDIRQSAVAPSAREASLPAVGVRGVVEELNGDLPSLQHLRKDSVYLSGATLQAHVTLWALHINPSLPLT